jgi:antitoxin CptB
MNSFCKKAIALFPIFRIYSVQNLQEKPICIKKLIYRASKRGMKETEEVLIRFINHHSENFTDEDVKAFQMFLDEADPDILKWLIIEKKLPNKFNEFEILRSLKDYWCDFSNAQLK